MVARENFLICIIKWESKLHILIMHKTPIIGILFLLDFIPKMGLFTPITQIQRLNNNAALLIGTDGQITAEVHAEDLIKV